MNEPLDLSKFPLTFKEKKIEIETLALQLERLDLIVQVARMKIEETFAKNVKSHENAKVSSSESFFLK